MKTKQDIVESNNQIARSCKSIELIRVMGALRQMIINAHTVHKNKTVQENSTVVQLVSVPICSAQLRFSLNPVLRRSPRIIGITQ